VTELLTHTTDTLNDPTEIRVNNRTEIACELARYTALTDQLRQQTPEPAHPTIDKKLGAAAFVVCIHCRWIDACEANEHCART
jgi:hypothetical protein